MQILRRLHLSLGCFFAPLLVFFAVSGLWQMRFAHQPPKVGEGRPLLALLSTIHTGRGLKLPVVPTLSSRALRNLTVLMVFSLVANIVLGVVMAFRFGHRRAAFWCLLAGTAVPLFCVALALRHAARILPDL